MNMNLLCVKYDPDPCVKKSYFRKRFFISKKTSCTSQAHPQVSQETCSKEHQHAVFYGSQALLRLISTSFEALPESAQGDMWYSKDIQERI